MKARGGLHRGRHVAGLELLDRRAHLRRQLGQRQKPMSPPCSRLLASCELARASGEIGLGRLGPLDQFLRLLARGGHGLGVSGAGRKIWLTRYSAGWANCGSALIRGGQVGLGRIVVGRAADGFQVALHQDLFLRRLESALDLGLVLPPLHPRLFDQGLRRAGRAAIDPGPRDCLEAARCGGGSACSWRCSSSRSTCTAPSVATAGSLTRRRPAAAASLAAACGAGLLSLLWAGLRAHQRDRAGRAGDQQHGGGGDTDFRGLFQDAVHGLSHKLASARGGRRTRTGSAIADAGGAPPAGYMRRRLGRGFGLRLGQRFLGLPGFLAGARRGVGAQEQQEFLQQAVPVRWWRADNSRTRRRPRSRPVPAPGRRLARSGGRSAFPRSSARPGRPAARPARAAQLSV